MKYKAQYVIFVEFVQLDISISKRVNEELL